MTRSVVDQLTAERRLEAARQDESLRPVEQRHADVLECRTGVHERLDPLIDEFIARAKEIAAGRPFTIAAISMREEGVRVDGHGPGWTADTDALALQLEDATDPRVLGK